jgi:hypothetical protein
MQSLPNGASLDPGNLNSFLDAQGASTCNLPWSDAAGALKIGVPVVLMPSVPWSQRQQEIDNALKAGDLPIVSVPSPDSSSGLHFVVLSKPVGNDYAILDPFVIGAGTNPIDRSGNLLFATYGSPQTISSQYLEVVHFVRGAPPQPSWAIRAHSPVQLLVTDPNGAQPSFIATTGSYI